MFIVSAKYVKHFRVNLFLWTLFVWASDQMIFSFHKVLFRYLKTLFLSFRSLACLIVGS